jgi:tetratricopeptide (TPR) repeat protein
MALDQPLNPQQRGELLLGLGDAQMKAGDTTSAQDMLIRAAEVARAHGMPELLASAALSLAEMTQFNFGRPKTSQPMVDLLEEALAALDERARLRVRVLAALAIALYWTGQATDREDAEQLRAALSAEAVQLARQHGDPAELALALHARCFARFGPDNLDERVALAPQILRHAHTARNHELALEGHHWRAISSAETGDLSAMQEAITAYTTLAAQLRQPLRHYWAHVWRGTRALLRGEFGAAEEHNAAALAVGQQLEGLDTTELQNGVGAQLLVLRREQGRMQELEPAIRGFIELFPMIPAWRVALAWIHSSIGDRAGAAQDLAYFSHDRFAGLPRDATWLPAIASLAEVCAFLADRDSAAILAELLMPYQQRCVVVTFGFAWLGPVAYYLGLLAATLGHLDAAARRFAHSLRLNQRAGARPWLVRTQYEYARVLGARGGPGDRDRGSVLLVEALHTAEELGMRSVPEWVTGA